MKCITVECSTMEYVASKTYKIATVLYIPMEYSAAEYNICKCIQYMSIKSKLSNTQAMSDKALSQAVGYYGQKCILLARIVVIASFRQMAQLLLLNFF